MVVTNNEIDETKNAGKLTMILVAMAMQRLRRIAPTAAMVDEFE